MEWTKNGKGRCEFLQFCLHNTLLCMAACLTGQPGETRGGGKDRGGRVKRERRGAVPGSVFCSPCVLWMWGHDGYICLCVCVCLCVSYCSSVIISVSFIEFLIYYILNYKQYILINQIKCVCCFLLLKLSVKVTCAGWCITRRKDFYRLESQEETTWAAFVVFTQFNKMRVSSQVCACVVVYLSGAEVWLFRGLAFWQRLLRIS